MKTTTAAALDSLREIATPREIRALAAGAESTDQLAAAVNTHIHVPPNFSAFESAAEAVELAAGEGLVALGLSNYYDFEVYGGFVDEARRCGIFPLFGLEVLSLDAALRDAGVKVNDPGNPGKFYLSGKGITRFEKRSLTAEARRLLEKIREDDKHRMLAVIDRLEEVFAERGLATGLTEARVIDEIAERYEVPRHTVYLQERHAARAFQEALFAAVPPERRLERLAGILGAPSKASDPEDAVTVQSEIRSHLMKAGQVAFVEERYVDCDEARRLVLELGGIPCYPVLADGATPVCPFEESPEQLVESLRERRIHLAEFIPVRNRAGVLRDYVLALRQAGLAVVAGTEHNTPERLPLEPACADGPLPEDIREIFWEGARVIAAHQFLRAHGESGFVDEGGDPCGGYADADSRLKAFARLGAAVIGRYRDHVRPRETKASDSPAVKPATPRAWPAFSPDEDPLDTIVKLSRFYGADPWMVLAGGGNTSVKTGDRLHVKASGLGLTSIDRDGFVELDRKRLRDLFGSELGDDPEVRERRFKEAILAARLEPEKGQRPSVESLLHELAPGALVVHSHPTVVNALACCRRGEEIARRLFGDDVLWVPYHDPGFVLAREFKRALDDFRRRTERPRPEAILMANHGLVVAGDTPEEIRRNTDELLRAIEDELGPGWRLDAFGGRQGFPPPARIEAVQAALVEALDAAPGRREIVCETCAEVLDLVGSDEGKRAATAGPVTPDQIVYCNSFPLWLEPAARETGAALALRFRTALEEHLHATGFPPRIILVRDLGLFAAGENPAAATAARDLYVDAIRVMAGARRLGGISCLTERERRFIEDWEVEAYRRDVAKREGRGEG